MNKFFNPPISIEKFAAFLDGNLPDEEMDNIESLVRGNEQMCNLVEESDYIDSELDAQNGISDITSFDYLSIAIPDVPVLSDDDFSSLASQLDDIHPSHSSLFHNEDDYGESANGIDSHDGDIWGGANDNDDFQL